MYSDPFLRRISLFVLYSSIVGLTAVGITQCRLADDPITNSEVRLPSTMQGNESNCERHCVDLFKQCRDQLEVRHSAALRACSSLASPRERKDCHRAEAQRHNADIATCREQLNACIHACQYHEGSGLGGR